MDLKATLPQDWQKQLAPLTETATFNRLSAYLAARYQETVVLPPKDQVFSALRLTRFENVKVVILGQDPYHQKGQAHGLSFSVNPSVKIPPSLRNIYQELVADLGCNQPETGYLVPWAKQGVLLMNTVLTVEEGHAHAHRHRGWEAFTDGVIRALNKKEMPIVYLLWGKPAEKKRALIDEDKHLVLTAPHPSPLSAYRGFFGSKPFSRANAFLVKTNQTPIDWCLT
ncbi:uracil-DNA glycosylase [Streptohalobacillus salinus]|uniref:Uracil-DNA glycosylase n=1 Tax=Streptohalobacillus salinus TaxID=621096 RepID=A0A2V3WQY0_9BACI|nr:uracil-DNA glycosylase [Streptohalobacillus salinus]PXW91089.1 uracil-DNA glycosylase [Streptohalobacillus salinus]